MVIQLKSVSLCFYVYLRVSSGYIDREAIKEVRAVRENCRGSASASVDRLFVSCT